MVRLTSLRPRYNSKEKTKTPKFKIEHRKFFDGFIEAWYKIPVNSDLLKNVLLVVPKTSPLYLCWLHHSKNPYQKIYFNEKYGRISYKQWMNLPPEFHLSISFSGYEIKETGFGIISNGVWTKEEKLVPNGHDIVDLCKLNNWIGDSIYVFGLPTSHLRGKEALLNMFYRSKGKVFEGLILYRKTDTPAKLK